MPARTQAEIVTRINYIRPDDFFGFRQEVLISALDFEHAKEFLKAGTTAEEWGQPEDAYEASIRYLTFAIDKALNHRGISASRSVDKLSEWAWLLGRDEVYDAMDQAPYPMYGVPKLKAFAKGLALEWPEEEHPELKRMADGEPCAPGCEEGCEL